MDKKIISGTIKDQVYKYLKDEICNRNFTPGYWLQELEIAQKLGVSRSPVREAIKHLAMDGLVIEIPNKGSYVREFTQKDVLDACDLRLMMETYALSQCKDNLTEANLNSLREFLKEFDYHYKKDNIKEYINTDTDFHQFMVSLSTNGMISVAYNRIQPLFQPFRIYSLLERRRFDDSIGEHKRIIGALLKKDIEKAIEENTKHLELVRNQTLEMYKTRYHENIEKDFS